MAKVKYRIREYTPKENMPGTHGYYAQAVIDNIITNKELAKKVEARTGMRASLNSCVPLAKGWGLFNFGGFLIYLHIKRKTPENRAYFISIIKIKNYDLQRFRGRSRTEDYGISSGTQKL